MNNQPPSKKSFNHAGDLDVHSIFKSIQGEGPFVGEPAVFIRLHGCNLQCPLCDTDYTSKKELLTVEELIGEVRRLDTPNRLVVITGGEPFLQNLTPFVYALLCNDFRIQIETNGTAFLEDFPYDAATIVCSPKTSRIHPKMTLHINAFKYVINADHVDVETGLPTRVLGRILPYSVACTLISLFNRRKVYIQPEDGEDYDANLQKAIAICEEFGYTLGIQLHKIIGKE